MKSFDIEMRMARVERPSRTGRILLTAAIAVFALLLVAAYFVLPPTYPGRSFMVTYEANDTLSSFATKLEKHQVVRSAFVLRGWLRITGADSRVQSGAYVFTEPQNLFRIADRISSGEFGVRSVRVTLTEGMTVREMSRTLATALPGFDTDAFLNEALPLEGYLFPDTYFFMQTATTGEVVARLYARGEEVRESLAEVLAESPYEESDIMIMASLLEKEARSDEARRMVAGILWQRIEDDMPLQVDAVFGYIFNRPTYNPSFDDLEYDSPYNTYRYRGLPPTPINNPGEAAIRSAATPIPSPYVYYLTDPEGVMRYAETFDEHRENRARYLD